MTKRIAMWSGPRNLSTAMMYSFGARGDARVVDEPFYAAYLAATGLDHPMGMQIMASQPMDPADVVKSLFSPVSEPIFYQKHMTHHMLPDWRMDWLADVKNVFLIRHPARVIASYARKREGPTLEDIGFVQQAAIFDRVDAPIVIDSADIRTDPAQMLQKLCARIGIGWDDNMLRWPIGGHAADGVWAAHWYGAVHRSTGFDGAEGPLPEVTGEYARIVDAAMPHYKALAAHKITLDDDPAPPTV
ncbi:HAD family hydrolase [Tateyamaria sp.]|uniref:sulfotransferase-like domain-containing protein n=1 Tax=Tateyamaria sp. TaxID=1929288 RepID=UPI003B216B50